MIDVTDAQIAELAEDPNLEAIYAGTTITEQVLYVVYDTDYDIFSIDRPTSIILEPEEEVIVTKHRDGTYFMHFMSTTPNRFHYKAPWISDDQVTHDEGAIYHV